jgi:hypothetical protein
MCDGIIWKISATIMAGNIRLDNEAEWLCPICGEVGSITTTTVRADATINQNGYSK